MIGCAVFRSDTWGRSCPCGRWWLVRHSSDRASQTGSWRGAQTESSSPLGIVSKRLSSSTEFNDSIHSGSMSPSHIIHELTSERDRMTSDTPKSQVNLLQVNVSGVCYLNVLSVLSVLMQVFEVLMCRCVVCQVFLLYCGACVWS